MFWSTCSEFWHRAFEIEFIPPKPQFTHINPIPYELLKEINFEFKIINSIMGEPKFNSCSEWERIAITYGRKGSEISRIEHVDYQSLRNKLKDRIY
jgi:hypothetical protein